MKLLLASSSPRRIELLKTLGFDLLVIAPDIDETPLVGEKPEVIVCRLAKLKAIAAAGQNPKNLPIIAADTVVCLDNLILGKPKDQEDAIRMLELLSGKTHEVLTGYAVIYYQVEKIGYVKSKITFRHLREDEIVSYVKTNEPFDKAGAYAIQGAGACLIDTVVGSFTNVMGLPVNEVLRDLRLCLSA